MTIRATFELAPEGSAAALAEELASGLATVVSEEGGRVVASFPMALWGGDVALLVSAVVAGKPTEVAAFTRCRLVDLELPEGALPGPAFGAEPHLAVGVIVKPALGLSPAEVAEVVQTATASENAPAQAARAEDGTVLLLGSAASRAPGGISVGVEAVVEALAAGSAPARPA